MGHPMEKGVEHLQPGRVECNYGREKQACRNVQIYQAEFLSQMGSVWSLGCERSVESPFRRTM